MALACTQTKGDVDTQRPVHTLLRVPFRQPSWMNHRGWLEEQRRRTRLDRMPGNVGMSEGE